MTTGAAPTTGPPRIGSAVAYIPCPEGALALTVTAALVHFVFVRGETKKKAKNKKGKKTKNSVAPLRENKNNANSRTQQAAP